MPDPQIRKDVGEVFKLMPQKQIIKTAVAAGTDADNQPGVQIQVFQDVRAMSTDNDFLEKCHLDEIPPAPRGAAQTEVTLDIDANESLNVSAQNKFTCRSNQITITSESGRMSLAETDHVVQEAEEYRDEDEINRTKTEVKNGSESHCVAM